MSPLLDCNRAFRRMKYIFGACCLAASPKGANAQQDLTVTLEANVIAVQPDGAARERPAERASPGDVIEYKATYRNVGTRRVDGVQATLPVPRGTRLVVQGAAPAETPPGGPLPPLASQDGRLFGPTPLQETFRTPDGRSATRPLPWDAYRFLRWPLGSLAAGQARTVTARVRVVGPEGLAAAQQAERR